MPSRRRVLAAVGGGALAALAGCQSTDDAATTTSTDSAATTDATDTTATNGTTGGGTYLDATPVEEPARVVPHQEPAVVASQLLYDLVVDAAASDGRVDAPPDLDLGSEARLALGDFRYVQFRGETYEPAASFAPMYDEESYLYEAVPANASEAGDGEVVEYGTLNDSERAIADAMLNDSYYVGFHESRPPAAETFEPQSYLRANNETYRVRVAVGDSAGHHMLTMTASGAGPQVAVPIVADRAPSTRVANALRRATAVGRTSIEDDADAVLSYLGDANYVVTAGGVFEVTLVRTTG